MNDPSPMMRDTMVAVHRILLRERCPEDVLIRRVQRCGIPGVSTDRDVIRRSLTHLRRRGAIGLRGVPGRRLLAGFPDPELDTWIGHEMWQAFRELDGRALTCAELAERLGLTRTVARKLLASAVRADAVRVLSDGIHYTLAGCGAATTAEVPA